MLIQAIDLDVVEVGRLARSIDTGAVGRCAICGTFTNVTPVSHWSITSIDVTGVVAKPCWCGLQIATGAIGVGHTFIFLRRIFVVVAVVGVPHVANQVAAVVVKGDFHWLVFNFGLYHSLAIVLIHHFGGNLITGQVHSFHCQSNGSYVTIAKCGLQGRHT